MLIIGIIVIIGILIINFFIIKGIKKSLTGRAQHEIEAYRQAGFQRDRDQYRAQLENEFNAQKQSYINELVNIKKETEQTKQFNSTLLSMREREIDGIIEEKRKAKEAELEHDISDWAKSAQEAANEYQRGLRAEMKLITDTTEEELEEIRKQLDEYYKKREAINQQILRERALKEKQDFYRIQLSPESIRDIEILEEIKPKLSKLDLLDKLVYDVYIKKPTDEMIKRVLEGRAPSGIYKITRLKTGEIYIGKSTDVKARWQQHTKTAFHCGTISHSILHTTMEKDGVENFTWELLEEVPKDKLGERERYWIEFYDSKRYGLNEKAGG